VLLEGATLHVTTETDVGRRRHETRPSGGEKREYAVPLEGARRLERIAVAVRPGDDGRGEGWLNWVGLQDPDLLERHLAQWDGVDARWEDHLRPPSYDPDFEPTVGLLLDDGDLAALCDRHARGEGLLEDILADARAATERPPEDRVGEFLADGGDARPGTRRRKRFVGRPHPGGMSDVDTGVETDTVEIGVVGTGGLGTRMLESFAELDRARVVAVADIDADALERAGSRFGVPPDARHADYGAMLDGGLDAVVVTTPHRSTTGRSSRRWSATEPARRC